MADYKFTNGGSVSTAQPAGTNNPSTIGATTTPKRIVNAHTGGAGKPRGVKHSHDDRNRDDLSDADPDLTLAELELRLFGEGHDLPTNRSGGGDSSKSVGPGQRKLESGMSSVDKHRGRPIKPHEKEAFLSVGTQDGRRRSRIKTNGTAEPGERPKSGLIRTYRSGATPVSQARLPYQIRSPYSSPSPSLGVLSGRSGSPGKMYLSPSTAGTRSNPRIKMPFKHSVKKPASTEPRAQSPSQELKEMTALATYHVTRILRAGGDGNKRQQNGRLQKGRLKPLYPVNISGPTIQQCRGIVADSRNYSPSASRTLQRRRQIVMQLKSGEMDSPCTNRSLRDGSDSVHRVSAASSLASYDDLADRDGIGEEEGESVTADKDFQAELIAMEKDALAAEEREDGVAYQFTETRSVSREGTASLAGKAGVVSRENTTVGAQSVLSLDQGLTDMPNPDFSTPAPPPSSAAPAEQVSPGENTVFLTQMQEKGDHVMTQTGSQSKGRKSAHRDENWKTTPSTKMDNRSVQQKDSRDVAVLERENNNVHVNNANNNFISEGSYHKPQSTTRRPKSAGIQYEETDFPKSMGKTRPKTAASNTKAVRFAEQTYASDGSEIPLSVSASWINEKMKKEEGENKEKKPSRNSCKPSDLDASQSGKKDGDNGDDGQAGGGKENKPPIGGGGGIVSAASGSKSDQSLKDGSSSASGTSSNQSQESIVEQASLAPSPVSLYAGRSASASVLSIQSIRLSEAGSRAENLSDVSLPFAYPSPSPPPPAPTSTTPRGTPTPAPKRQQVEWTPDGVEEGGGKAPRALVPDGASLLKLLLEVASRTGEPSVSFSQSSVTHLTDSTSLTATRSEVTSTSSTTTTPADSHSGVAVNNDTSASHTNVPTPSNSSGTSTDVTATNSDMSIQCSVTPSRSATDSTEKFLSPHGTCLPEVSSLPQMPQSAEQASFPHAPCATKEYDTLSARVSVTFCKHNDSQKPNKPLQVPEHPPGKTRTRDQEADDRASVKSNVSFRQSAERQSLERKLAARKSGHSAQAAKGSNTLSELYTHFSLGFDTNADDHNAKSHHVDKLTGKGKKECAEEESRIDEAVDSNSPMPITGILKKKVSAAPGSPSHSTNTYLRTKLFRSTKTHYDFLTSELGCSGDTQYDSSVDFEGHREPVQQKPKWTKRMRQIYTHHSDQPFIYPSDDPFSSGVAIRLKYGDSPYLKEMKLPKQRIHPRKAPEKAVLGKLPDMTKSGHGEHLKSQPLSAAQQGGPKSLLKRHQPRVKFADFSMETLNLNQNCAITTEDDDVGDGVGAYCEAEVDDVDVETLALCYPCGGDGEEGIILLPHRRTSEEQVAADGDDLAARFSALEAELCATTDVDQGDGPQDREASDDEDGWDGYSTYYRNLLMAYRQKCMLAGEGNLVISDRLTWPFVYSSTSSANPSSGDDTNTAEDSSKASHGHSHSRPGSASHHPASKFHASCMASKSLDTHANAAGPRSESRCDSGFGSDGQSDLGERLFHRLDSMQSADGDSVNSGHSNRTTPTPAQQQGAKQGEGAVKGKGAPRQIGDSGSTPQLEVIASSVPKSKAQSLSATLNAPVAPFPPLCFAVNARPPPGSLFFFTYATYMNPDRLGSLLQRQVSKRYWAILFGFDLAFNKKGSDEECGGLANIVFNPFASVEGCIFQLTPAELDQMDAFTNCPEHYTRVVLPVWMSEVSGSESDLDLARYCVPAVTYIAQDGYTLKGSSKPNEFEATQCLKSADILTPSYCDHLRSFSVMASHANLQPAAS
ncbi:hypothetical protein BaRGS_00011735 [Batillaria attramentaria]|uniref:Uncharacterized protein n=1 Tax=Batillaria attramentaria TaxID=370345 RepID=A0ABD0LC32_9CAEN